MWIEGQEASDLGYPPDVLTVLEDYPEGRPAC
jgi:hypothetical protein